MALHFEMINPDEIFKSLKFKPIILNELNQDLIENREYLKNLATTVYGQDTISLENVPTCNCGELTTSLNLGRLCSVCDSRVDFDHTRKLESMLWIRSPDNVAGMFTPIAWHLLSASLSVPSPQKWNGLEWLCKTDYKSPDSKNKKALGYIEVFKSVGLKRGLNNIVTNLSGLIEALTIISKRFTPASSRNTNKTAMTIDLLSGSREKVVCQYLAIPDKIAFVIEKTAMGDYSDGSIRHAMDAIYTVARIKNDASPTRVANRIVSAMVSLSEYYDEVLYSVIAKKSGWLRKAVYGSRLFFSYRSTITSETGEHDYEAIKIPYPQASVLFRLHLINRFINKHGMSSREAYEFLEYNSVDIHPLILEEMNDLIRTANKGKGFATTLTRYPSLDPTSTQRLWIRGITEMSTTISVLVIAGPNADKVLKAA